MTNRKIQYWVIPPKFDAEFVAHMENVLETYEQAYDKQNPVLCMDEQPFQFHKETRNPIPATRTNPMRVDYEYERSGTGSIFMFTEPLAGWREATVRPQRTKSDWAKEVGELVLKKYHKAKKVTLVCDNLNTHSIGSFYEVYPPKIARKIVKKIQFCYTPKHGSWLNIAENELSSLTRQCTSKKRFEDIATLREELKAWTTSKNKKQTGVDWQFKIDDSRQKLKSLYPKI